MDFRVRPETPADVAAIEAVTIAAFALAEHAEDTEHFIVNALRRAGALAVSLVAEDTRGIVVGHLAVSPVTIAGESTGWFGLGPISVVPVHQGQGVGSALVKVGLSFLRRMDARGCVVVGDPKYYARFGFTRTPRLQFPDVPGEYFQSLGFGLDDAAGTVEYHEAFSAKS